MYKDVRNSDYNFMIYTVDIDRIYTLGPPDGW